MKTSKPQIISVSRRTDIPAYYADWFRERLEKGYAHYRNPISGKPVLAELTPEKVRAFVFWTRNPRPLFEHLDYIDERYGNKHYMHFTINGLPEILEKRNPKIDFAIESVNHLFNRYGKKYVQWRFDPIILTSISPSEYFIEKFDEISEKLSGIVERCYFSFIDLYKKTLANIKKTESETGIKFHKPDFEEEITLVKNIKRIADKRNITLFACAEDQVLDITGIEKAHCIDQDLINKLDGDIIKYKASPSREGCGCIESRDIGYYDSCPHGCIYCYANMDPEESFTNAKKYLYKGFPFDSL